MCCTRADTVLFVAASFDEGRHCVCLTRVYYALLDAAFCDGLPGPRRGIPYDLLDRLDIFRHQRAEFVSHTDVFEQ